jgi:hypothetical protein
MAAKKEEINFGKLPKKVLEYIKDIERERETAITALHKHLDNQTESPFYYNDYLCTGEGVGPTYTRTYIQTYKMEVKHAGVVLRVMLRDNVIDLHWESISAGMHQIAFVPHSFQGARLVSKENMD